VSSWDRVTRLAPNDWLGWAALGHELGYARAIEEGQGGLRGKGERRRRTGPARENRPQDTY
jgi:hypothetical protein